MAYGSIVLGESYACTGIDVDYNICNVPFDVVEQTYLDTPDDPHADEFLALLHSRAQYHSEPTENAMCMGIKNAILDFLR